MSRLPATRDGQGDGAGRAPSTTETSAVEFLELLAREATSIEFEGPLLAARRAGAEPRVLAELERAKALALQVRAAQKSRRRRESELTALFETVGDLASLKDLDDVLEAIVRRVRQLLGSDVSYLSLNDESRGDTYMRVTDGVTSARFKAVRLPFGAGLGGLVAQTATPYASADYFNDARFRHTENIDAAVADEELVSIAGVPLLLGRRVIGVLYAANHTARPFGREDVSLLTSLAAHAAVAIDNARLLTETQAALADLKATSELLRQHALRADRASDAHDRLAEVVLRGGSAQDVVREIAEVLDGAVFVLDPQGEISTGSVPRAELTAAEGALVAAVVEHNRSERSEHACACPVAAGARRLGVLVLRRDRPVDDADRRILERAATVTALLLLVQRSVADTESRLRGDLLADLILEADRDAEALQDRARRLGADLDEPHTVVVADVDGHRSRAARAAEHLAAVTHGLSTVLRHRVVVVLPGRTAREGADLVSDHLEQALGATATVGAAGPARGPAAIVAAHAEAVRCVDALLALGRAGDTACATELGFVGLLIGGDQHVAPFVQERLGPVVGYDAERGTALVTTLEAYFAHGQHLGRTAAALTVHPNTVTQRLERISQLLGPDWTEPANQLEVQLALRLNRLLGRPGS